MKIYTSWGITLSLSFNEKRSFEKNIHFERTEKKKKQLVGKEKKKLLRKVICL